MRMFLAPRVGTGTFPDPYRPEGCDDGKWASFRYTDTQLLVVRDDIVSAPAGTLDLGDNTGEVWTGAGATITALANQLGVDRAEIDGLTIGDVMYDRRHPSRPPLIGRREGAFTRYLIRLNGHTLLDRLVPFIVNATDAFTYSDGALSGNSSWASISGWNSFDVSTNELDLVATASEHANYFNSAVESTDHYMQADIDLGTADPTDTSYFVFVRHPTGTAQTFYRGGINYGGGIAIREDNAGAESTIASDAAYNPAAGVTTWRLEVIGTSLELFADGTSVLSGTDATLTTGQMVGLFGYDDSSTTQNTIDNAEWGSLGLITLSESANVPAGGEATTGLLTAPAGKTPPISPAGTDVEITANGAKTASGSHTLVAGSNRIVVVIAQGELGRLGGRSPTCTYGGQSMSLVGNALLDTGFDQTSQVFVLLEANLPANGSQTVSYDSDCIADGGGTPAHNDHTADMIHLTVMQFNEVSQVVPSGGAVQTTTATNTGATQTLTFTGTTVGDLFVAGMSEGGPYTVTWGGDETPTELFDTTVGSTMGAASSRVFSNGTIGDITATPSSSANRLTMIAVRFDEIANFSTGRRWDDENGTDTLDHGLDDYTEYEWWMEATADAVDTDQFEFRVVIEDTALDAYTVTPKWTIGDPGDLTAYPPVLPLSLLRRMSLIR